MKYIETSKTLIIGKQTETEINLFVQFFIHSNKERRDEIQFCLKENVMNPFITNIYLLNERLYTDEELGINNKKIVQIIIGNRLLYSDVFNMTKQLKCTGYNILANADIFFDHSLLEILKSNMNEEPLMMAQLRWDYNGTPTGIKIFGPRADSQDAWIWHTKFNEKLIVNKAFNFQLGQAGCDNHVAYLFKVCGFELVNDPELVHCLHYHKTEIRDYVAKDRVADPYICIIPNNSINSLVKDISIDDHNVLYDYILNKLEKNEKFIIPRISCVESVTAYQPERVNVYTMKNNAGIKLSSDESTKKWVKNHLDSFKNCDIYLGWSKHNEDRVYQYITEPHEMYDKICDGKKKVWSHCLDVFEQIKRRPYTLALKGKRILIVSAFMNSIKEKLLIREKIYGIDLFPDCEFVFIRPPQTNGNNTSEEWDIELNKFYTELDKIKDDYDVALVSAGGYGTIICNYIYNNHNKSSIYVGGVLQMYFGIYGNRWLVERASILRMYMNKYWSRPKEDERPQGYKGIESNCYW
jgi:hypothetical protein